MSGAPRRRRLAVAWLVGCALVASEALVGRAALAQTPIGVVNARTETHSAARGLVREIDAAVARGGPAWIGYRVAKVRRQGVTLSNAGSFGRCHLEPSTDLLVLARVDGGRIAQLRSSDVDCDLDAGGVPLTWLTDVAPDESVTWLRSLIDGPERFAAAVLGAIAQHDAPSAAPALIALARQDSRPALRGKALFWVAQRASADATRTIAGAIDDDPDVEVKKKAVFALSQLPADQAVPALIDVARSHKTLAVRRQAMFWLGQSKDPRALEFFSAILLR